jgi:hypothetical protein
LEVSTIKRTLSGYPAFRTRIHNSAYYQANSADETMQGAAVHWKVDTETQELMMLAVAARATGWLGFGMAEVR